MQIKRPEECDYLPLSGTPAAKRIRTEDEDVSNNQPGQVCDEALELGRQIKSVTAYLNMLRERYNWITEGNKI